jgi:uncharacterized OB-fold protein
MTADAEGQQGERTDRPEGTQGEKAGKPEGKPVKAVTARPQLPLAGKALTEEQLKGKKVLVEEWKDTGLSYSWSTGVAIGTYLEGLKKGRILGVRCRSCKRIMVPPRMFCEECFRTIDEFVPVQDTGTVNTFAICYIKTDASRQKRPQIPAVVELDGATKGMGILHLLGEVRPRDVKIGMKVKAVWKPARERKGDITDIKYFKPAEQEKKPEVRAAEKQKEIGRIVKSAAKPKNAGKRDRKGARGGS